MAEDRLLWIAPAAAALAVFAVPNPEILVLALFALSAGCVLQGWRGDTGFCFAAGASSGFAVWLTPLALPFALLIFMPLFICWLRKPNGLAVLSCAAGFIDVIGFGFAINRPKGGYLTPDIHHLSVLYIILGILLFLGASCLWRLRKWDHILQRNVSAIAIMLGLLLIWSAIFFYYARHDSAFMNAFKWPELNIYLPPGVLALCYIIWRAFAAHGAWPWIYVMLYAAIVLILGEILPGFAAFPAVIAAAFLPVALSEGRQVIRKHRNFV